MVNGIRYEFFHSTKGLKKGDPLSPGFFILAAEALTKALNHLCENEGYKGYFMQQRGLQVNHLYYADDIVIFNSWDKASIKMIMKKLHQYEVLSGQEISKEKSFFLTATYTLENRRKMIKRIAGFQHQCFPFKYLGCPIYPGRKKINYFTNVAKVVINKISGWEGKLLSIGGRATLIKHVLQSQTIYTMSSMFPPKIVLKQLEKYFCNFFCGQTEDKKKYD